MTRLLLYTILGLFAFIPNKLAERFKSNNGVSDTNTTAFTYGEKIVYTVKYNMYFNINVGEVNFEIKPTPQKIAGMDCFQIVGLGSTYGFYDPFYRVRDHYESYVDSKTLLPVVFIRNVNEGGYKLKEYVIFNHQNNTAKSTKRTQKIPHATQDVLSSLYYARTFDYDNAKPGQNFMLHTFIDDSAYYLGVKYVGKETIKTDAGKFRCIKLKPLLIVDRLFKSEDDMTLWVTDDENRIPVMIESGISVGKIKAELKSYSGLKNSLISKL
jgi:hypothetical protein